VSVGLVLLPLRRRWQICLGLVLIPAGPGIVRRIGLFEGLHKDEIEDVVVQEVTIV